MVRGLGRVNVERLIGGGVWGGYHSVYPNPGGREKVPGTYLLWIILAIEIMGFCLLYMFWNV